MSTHDIEPDQDDPSRSEPSQPEAVQNKSELSRRDFLKATLATSGALGVLGAAGAGFVNGKDYATYTGNTIFHGEGQFFNRRPFQVSKPTYKVVGATRPAVYQTEHLMGRFGTLGALMTPGEDGTPPAWTPDMGPEALPEPMRTYILENPEKLDGFFRAGELQEKQLENWELVKDDFFLADIWSYAQESGFRDNPNAGRPLHKDRRRNGISAI